ncbi:GNAT family acetyltransferase [Bifidobacterium choerinum]|uniref:GNAT family acetyltransferase n=3 Tax=Bifidobacterium choerinum TaxID=35760 RepID=A0A087AI68_9BIFI|nr:GNAT family acetyltransferase [Bifidobacterium choerinum]
MLGAMTNMANTTETLTTERLALRPWRESDAEALYEYAKNPNIGPIAGWPAHRSVEESLDVIRTVLNGPEDYAITLAEDQDTAIGAIALKFAGDSDLFPEDDMTQTELGFWIGEPFWGNGYVPEAARELLRHGFEDLNLTAIWCAYYDGNTKSARAQQKIGFEPVRVTPDVPVPLLHETRTAHENRMTLARWQELQSS